MTVTREQEILTLLSKEKSRQRGFAILVEEFREPIYWHIRRLVVRHEDAQDVMQECFINIYRFVDDFKRESSLSTWIYRIATNEALRHCTKRRLETESYDQRNGLINLFEAEPNIEFGSAEALLQKAILALPQKQRVVFNLRYFDQLSYEQIAQITESSVATLKTNYHYAYNKIKEYLLSNMEE